MIQIGSLVVYKGGPAIVRNLVPKMEIEKSDGGVLRIREKDVILLHPGPVSDFSSLSEPPAGEIEEAWEILAGRKTNLEEVVELAFGSYSPAAALAVWNRNAETGLFRGTPDNLTALGREEIERLKLAEENRRKSLEERKEFIERIKEKSIQPDDRRHLADVESLAFGRSDGSRTLRDLGKTETPENAHALLLELSVWDKSVNPYPSRSGLATTIPTFEIVKPAEVERRDLTHLEAYAIDDEGATTPDDAISWDGEKIWVHVADPACLLSPSGEADREIRTRGATLHLPEAIVHMLPEKAVTDLGLGLKDVSPALSLSLADGGIDGAQAVEVVSSLVRVRRLTYEEADDCIGDTSLADIEPAILKYREFRLARGAVSIDLPEVRVKVDRNGRVDIHPVTRKRSRKIVEEAMIMAGEAAARWAIERELPVPFTSQETVDGAASGTESQSLSSMWEARRHLRRSSHSIHPGAHAGLGLACYAQVTSPLRRYLDLLAHYQIRSVLRNEPPLDADEITRRLGEIEAVLPSVRRTEQQTEKHWIMVYLLQNPRWRGEAVVVARRGGMHTVVIPDLALETAVFSPEELPLDSVFKIKLENVRLPFLEAHFSIL